jgi:hypothetical protein
LVDVGTELSNYVPYNIQATLESRDMHRHGPIVQCLVDVGAEIFHQAP